MQKTYSTLSIKTKISIVFVLVSMGVCWMLMVSIQWNLKNKMTALLEEQQFSSASYIASDIDAKLRQRMDLLHQSALLLTEHMGSPDQAKRFLEGRFDLHTLFPAGLIVVDKNGRGVVDYPVVANRGQASFSEMEFFKEAMATGTIAIGKPRIGRFIKKPGVAIAAPIRDKSGEINGILVGIATLSDSSLFGQVEQSKVGKSGLIIISSPRDRMIISASDSSRILQDLPILGNGEMLDRFIAGHEGSAITMNSQGVKTLVSAKKIPSTGWFVHMTLPAQEAFAPMQEMTKFAFGVAIALTVLANFGIWLLLRQALKPLEKTTARMHAMTTGKEQIHTLALAGDREIQELQSSFNTLIEQRKAAENKLRAEQRFVQNTLDGLTAHICVIDQDGVILSVNRAWRDFAAANEGLPIRCNEGMNYLMVCNSFVGHDSGKAARFLADLKSVLDGSKNFLNIEYSCHSAQEKRWFLAHISRLPAEDPVRVVIAHENITERKLAENSIKNNERRLREAQQIAKMGSWELDIDSNALIWSDEVFEIFGIDPKKFGASFDIFIAAIHPDDRERVNTTYTRSVENHSLYDTTHRIVRPDGSVRYVHERGETSYGPDGKPLRTMGTVQDVTLATLNDLALKESEERFRTIADYTYGWEYWQDPQSAFLYMSPSCQRITGYTQDEFISNPHLVYEIILPEDRSTMERHLTDIYYQDEGSLDFRIVRKDGEIRWIAHGCRAVFAKDGRFLGRRVSNHDITDRKTVEAQVQQLAYFDALTGLPNRRMLLDRLEQTLSQAKRHERALAIMFLDLDNFKKINDTFGHDTGDELLKKVAVRLEACIRSGDTVARQGGDEFIIVLAEINGSDDAALVAQKIITALADPVCIGEKSLQVTTSIGIAVYPVHGRDDMQDLLKKADGAMYQAKSAGRNGYRFYQDSSEVSS